MEEFEGLDLQSVEEQIDITEAEVSETRVVLDILDDTKPATDWLELIASGAVLVLSVDGDLNELAAGFARDVRDAGGDLMHFRGFLVVTPPGVDIDANRLE